MLCEGVVYRIKSKWANESDRNKSFFAGSTYPGYKIPPGVTPETGQPARPCLPFISLLRKKQGFGVA